MLKFFKNLSITNKLGVCFFLLLVLIIFAEMYEFSSSKQFQAISLEQEKVALASEQSLWLSINTLKVDAAVANYAETSDPKYKVIIEETRKAIQENLNTLQRSAETPEELQLINTYIALREEKKVATNKVTQLVASGEGSLEDIAKLVEERERIEIEGAGYLTKISDYKKKSFQAFAEQSKDRHNRLQWNLIVASIFLTIFAIIVFIVTSRSIVGPLKTLTIATQEIAKGNLAVALPNARKDEIGKLAQAFSEMTSKLKASYENLEGKVQDKTKELAKKVAEVEIQNNALFQERTKIETIIKSIGDGVFVVDQNGKIIMMNAVAEQLSGYEFAESQGKHYNEIFKFMLEAEPGTPYPPFIEEVISKGVIKEMANHTVLVTKQGTHLPVSDSAAPIREKDGTIFGCVVVFRDVSRERELEEAKDNFLSIAAHQLRTPLGITRWNLEMIINEDYGKPPKKMKDVIENIYTGNQRLLRLVNDLLDVSRIDQHKVKMEPALTDISTITKDVIKDFGIEAKQKDIKIGVALENNLPEVFLDPNKYRDVISNLLSNAIKYTPTKGSVHVAMIKDKDAINIKITDNGIGIPSEEQKRLFTKFFRAANAVHSETEGSGLGLFVVKSYVSDWGGTITYRENEKQGSIFEFTIPLTIK